MRSKALPGWAHTLCTAAAALVFLLAYELVNSFKNFPKVKYRCGKYLGDRVA